MTGRISGGRWVTGRWGVTGRSGITGMAGVSAAPFDGFNLAAGVGDDLESVRANRLVLAQEIGLPPENLVWMSQVHGTAIAEVLGPTAAAVPATDGMVSRATKIALTVMVADCVPVLAADRSAGVIAVAHAGRLGAAGGIVPALIGRMTGLGARVSDIEVLLGPAICGRCYEVPAAMCDDVEAQLPGSACRTRSGTAGLDLRAGLLRQLRALQVGAVEVDPRCTMTDPDLYSHRRSAPTGRFAGVIRL